MITVKIGDTEVQYHVVLTTAPKNYDGFGSFTLDESIGEARNYKRFVLVNDRHLTWQVGRYASGMYRADVQEEKAINAMRRHIETQLWRKLENPSLDRQLWKDVYAYLEAASDRAEAGQAAEHPSLTLREAVYNAKEGK
jgi:hypothetical protein